jgi:hypothetical protein
LIYAGKFPEPLEKRKNRKNCTQFQKRKIFFADSRQKVANSPIAATKVGMKIVDVHNHMKKPVFRIRIQLGQWIRIQKPDPEGKKDKVEKN